MRIVIIGAGGVGGYLAVKLASTGVDVSVLARGAHLEAIKKDGLRLKEPDRESVVQLSTFDKVVDVGPADLVVFGVKAQQLAAAIEDARPLLADGGLALSFQNGVDAPDMLNAAFGAEQTLIGVARIFATIGAPGRIDKVSSFASFTIGDFEGHQSGRVVEDIRETFSNADINVPDCDDVRIELWEKFVLMNAVSGITAAARCDVGTARAHPETWSLFRSLASEAAAVGTARGVDLNGVVDRVMAGAEKTPSTLRASQAHDLEAGKPLEVDWLSGAAVRLGKELNVPTPASEAILAILAPWRSGRA